MGKGVAGEIEGKDVVSLGSKNRQTNPRCGGRNKEGEKGEVLIGARECAGVQAKQDRWGGKRPS